MNTSAEPSLPYAPIWRRFAAAVYDSLLLLALWLSGTLLTVVGQELLGIPSSARSQHFISCYYFLVGLLFFGWCWTHGGQTPGMLAWRLRLQREDGNVIRWPVAAVRYVAVLLCWSVTLLPVLAAVAPLRSRFPILVPAGWTGLALLALSLAWTRLDRQRRSPQDRIASTVTLALPKKA